MLIAKLFLPMAAPGLAAMGTGLVGVTSGTVNTIQVVSIVFGLIVFAIAGLFTVRAKVVKTYQDLAEGRAQQLLDAAKEMADFRIEMAALLAEAKRAADEQRELKHQALTELATAKMRTDITPLLPLVPMVAQVLSAVTAAGPLEVTGERGGPIHVEQTGAT